MAVYLPISTERARDDDLRAVLDGRAYRFAFAWNTTGEFWTFDLKRDDGSYLLRGLRFTLGVNMLRQFVGEEFPPGRLVAVDTSGLGQRAGRRDLFSGRVQLVYIPASEVSDA